MTIRVATGKKEEDVRRRTVGGEEEVAVLLKNAPVDVIVREAVPVGVMEGGIVRPTIIGVTAIIHGLTEGLRVDLKTVTLCEAPDIDEDLHLIDVGNPVEKTEKNAVIARATMCVVPLQSMEYTLIPTGTFSSLDPRVSRQNSDSCGREGSRRSDALGTTM